MLALRALGQLAPAIVILAVGLRLRRTLGQLRAAGATSPRSSRSLAELGIRRGVAVRLLSRHGVLVETAPGAYYLDEAAYLRWRRRRRIILAVGLSAVALLALALALAER